MGVVAILVACVGAVIAIASFVQKKRCTCDDCCCDDELELYDSYDDSVDESEISEETDLEKKDEDIKCEKK